MSIKKIQKHWIQHGKHPLYHVWKGPRERDYLNEEWATIATYFTMATCETHSTPQGRGGQLDEGIEVEQLLANFFAREDPTLEARPSRPVDTPRLLVDVAEEVQRMCEILESVTTCVAEVTPQEDGLTL